ncbi:hypothetical protein ACPJHQ_17790 [Rossellomorea sp. H39__3]
MLLFFHEGAIAVSVFHRHQPVFFRNISLSGDSDVMDPIQSDEILKEVEKVISFYRYTLHDDGTMITKLFVGGSICSRNPITPCWPTGWRFLPCTSGVKRNLPIRVSPYRRGSCSLSVWA